MAGCSGVRQLDKADRYVQKLLTHELAAGARRALQAGCSEEDRRRLVSSAGFRATSWLRAIPAGYHLQIPNSEFRTGLQFFLHVPVACLLACPLRCPCWRKGATEAAVVDVLGQHDMGCKNHDKLARHNNILDALIAACKLVGIPAERKNILGYMRRRLPDGTVDPADKSKKQPDGAFKLYHVHDLTTLADVTCTHPTTASNMKKSYRSVGCLGTEQEQVKDVKYDEEARRLQFRLQPAGCETYGAPGEGLVKLVEDIARHAGAEGNADTRTLLGWGAPHVREFAWQAIGVGRIRGIASALERSAKRRAGSRGAAVTPPEAGPSAPLQRVVGNRAAAAAVMQPRARAARRAVLAATRDESVLYVGPQVSPQQQQLRAPPSRLAQPPSPPLAACVPANPAGDESVSFSDGFSETQRDGEGLSSAAPAPLRRRGNKNPSGVLGAYRGRSLFGLVGCLVFLWCLAVAVFFATDRRVAVLAGRVAALEDAGRWTLDAGFVETDALAVPRCLECSDGVFV